MRSHSYVLNRKFLPYKTKLTEIYSFGSPISFGRRPVCEQRVISEEINWKPKAKVIDISDEMEILYYCLRKTIK